MEARIGRQTPTTSVVLPYEETFGDEAIRLYESTGRKAQEWQKLLIYDIMETPRGLLSPEDDLAWAMANFDRYDVKYLPVCGSGGKFEGFVSREAIFSKYRRVVREADSF